MGLQITKVRAHFIVAERGIVCSANPEHIPYNVVFGSTVEVLAGIRSRGVEGNNEQSILAGDVRQGWADRKMYPDWRSLVLGPATIRKTCIILIA
jgi:hypothetical protein